MALRNKAPIERGRVDERLARRRNESGWPCIMFKLPSFTAATKAPTASRGTKYYEFRNGFWMNLHHTLFREAVVEKMDEQAREKSSLVPLSSAGLSKEEKETWDRALHFYAVTFARRRLLFDDQLVVFNNLLGDLGNREKLNSTGLPEDFVKCLESAAPVYRNHWWPEHQKANEQFIAEMRPKVEDFGPEVIPQLERSFEMKWQTQPLPIDVTYYVAEVGGAYTTTSPGHTTIASSREDTHGLAGLETLFLEGAHTLTDKMASALRDECERQKTDCDDLWHATQFYTVGAVVRKVLAGRGTPDYVPYADKFGLYQRGSWPKFRPALGLVWQAYLDGKSNFDQAIANLVRSISVPRDTPPTPA